MNSPRTPARLAVAGALLAVIGPAGAHWGAVSPIAGFGLFVGAAVLGLAALIWGVAAWRRHRRASLLVSAAVGLALALLVVVPALRSRGAPPINDVATDLEAPPALREAARLPGNAGRDMELPDDFAPILRAAYPELHPLSLAAPPDVVFEEAVSLARAQAGWEVHHVDPSTRRLEAVATSGLFRFPDDVAVEVRTAAGGGSVVHMRSKSRFGRGDLGVNAARVQAFLGDLARTGEGGRR